MPSQNPVESLAHIFGADAEQKRRWYSPAAEAYNAVRPKYPEDVIAFAVDTADLKATSRILEIGCGPGTATTAFAARGFSIIAVEPNPDFLAIARRNCELYPNARFHNSTFEELPLEAASFDCVIAATSMHWVSADTAYTKAADALVEGGRLILLWNMVLQPSDEANRRFAPAYQSRAPRLLRPETDSAATQELHLRRSGEIALKSRAFHDLQSIVRVVPITYFSEDYLRLLTTYSQYLALDPAIRDGLFADIRRIIDNEFGGRLALTYRSACQVMRKRL
jgi:SAM-dependent methyltransferase